MTTTKDRAPQPRLLNESSVDFTDPEKGRAVRSMFAAIARRYDFLNHLTSFNQDQRWRRDTVKLAAAKTGDHVLDVCCGTGDLAFAFGKAVGSTGAVTGSDFTPEMLLLAQRKIRGEGAAVAFLAADTLHLPFAGNTFDVCSVGFGIRNVQDVSAGIREMMRVVKSGGRVAILEFTTPPNGLIRRGSAFYKRRVVPMIGNLLSRSKEKAYSYLPDSIELFPDAPKLKALMEAAGLQKVAFHYRMFGVVAIHVGTKP